MVFIIHWTIIKIIFPIDCGVESTPMWASAALSVERQLIIFIILPQPEYWSTIFFLSRLAWVAGSVR